MRIAILSDIHGNFIALETVLADLKRERVDQIVCLGDYRATIMAGGHTHAQMLRRYQSSILINPGSIGMPVERSANEMRHPPWAEYAITHSQNGNLDIEFRRVPFDFGKLVRAVRESGMPNVEWWLEDWR